MSLCYPEITYPHLNFNGTVLSWKVESLWSWRGPTDPWSNRVYDAFREDPCWRGWEYHRLLLQGNHRGLNCYKVLERVSENFLQQVSLDGFIPGCRTTDAILIVRQLHEKFYAVNKKVYMAFVDLEKALDHVLRCFIWCSLSKLGVELLVRFAQIMYENARSRLRVGSNLSDGFGVKFGVYRGSWLSPYCSFGFWKLSPQNVPGKTCTQMTWSSSLSRWMNRKSSSSSGRPAWKERDFNMGKTKVLISRPWLGVLLQESNKDPCTVCFNGVSTSSVIGVVSIWSTSNAVVYLAL